MPEIDSIKNVYTGYATPWWAEKKKEEPIKAAIQPGTPEWNAAMEGKSEREKLLALYKSDMAKEEIGIRNRTPDGKTRVWSLADPKDPDSLQYTEIADSEKLDKGGAFLQSAAHNIGGGLGTAAGIGTGAAIGTAIGGPVGTAVGAGIGLVASLVGGWLGSKGQRAIEKQIWTPEERQHRDALLELAKEEHPVASWIGETTPDLIAMATPTGFAKGAAARVAKMSNSAAKTAFAASATAKSAAQIEQAVASQLTTQFGKSVSQQMIASAAKSAAAAAMNGGEAVTEKAIANATKAGLSAYASPAVSYTTRKGLGGIKFGEKGREAALARYSRLNHATEVLDARIRANVARLESLEKAGSGELIDKATDRILKNVSKESLQKTITRQKAALERARSMAEEAGKALGGNFISKGVGSGASFAAFNAGKAGMQMEEAGIGPGESDFWKEGLGAAARGMQDGLILGWTGAALEHGGGMLAESAFGKRVMSRIEQTTGWKELNVENRDRFRSWLKPITGYTLGMLGAVPEGAVASFANHALDTTKYAIGWPGAEKPDFKWEDTWHTMAQFAFFKMVFGIKALPGQHKALKEEINRKHEQYDKYKKLRQEEYDTYRTEQMAKEAPVADYDTYWKAQENADMLESMYRHGDTIMRDAFASMIQRSAEALRKAQDDFSKLNDGDPKKDVIGFILGFSDKPPENVRPDEAKSLMEQYGFPEADIDNFIGKNEKWAGTQYGPEESRPYANGLPRMAEQQKARIEEIAQAVGKPENAGILVDTGEGKYVSFGVKEYEDGTVFDGEQAQKLIDKHETGKNLSVLRIVSPETKPEEVSWERAGKNESAQQEEIGKVEIPSRQETVQRPEAIQNEPPPQAEQKAKLTDDALFSDINTIIEKGNVSLLNAPISDFYSDVSGVEPTTPIAALAFDRIGKLFSAEDIVNGTALSKYPGLKRIFARRFAAEMNKQAASNAKPVETQTAEPNTAQTVENQPQASAVAQEPVASANPAEIAQPVDGAQPEQNPVKLYKYAELIRKPINEVRTIAESLGIDTKGKLKPRLVKDIREAQIQADEGLRAKAEEEQKQSESIKNAITLSGLRSGEDANSERTREDTRRIVTTFDEELGKKGLDVNVSPLLKGRKTTSDELKDLLKKVDSAISKLDSDQGHGKKSDGGSEDSIRKTLRIKRNAILARMRDMAQSTREEAEALAKKEVSAGNISANEASKLVAAFVNGTTPGSVDAKNKETKFVRTVANFIRFARAIEAFRVEFGQQDGNKRRNAKSIKNGEKFFGLLLNLSERILRDPAFKDEINEAKEWLEEKATPEYIRKEIVGDMMVVPKNARHKDLLKIATARAVLCKFFSDTGIRYGMADAGLESGHIEVGADGQKDGFSVKTGLNGRRDTTTVRQVHIDAPKNDGTTEIDDAPNVQEWKFRDAFAAAIGETDVEKVDKRAEFLMELFTQVHVRNTAPQNDFEASLFLGQTMGKESLDAVDYATKVNERGVAHIGNVMFERGGEQLERRFYEGKRILPENRGNPEGSDGARAIAADLLNSLPGSKITIGLMPESADVMAKADEKTTGSYDPKTNELWLSSDKAQTTTMAHEPVHFLVSMIRRTDPKAAERLLELFKTAKPKLKASVEEQLQAYRNAKATDAEIAEEALAICVAEILRESGRIDSYLADKSAVAWFKNADRIVNGVVKSSIRGVGEAVKRYMAAKGWISYNGPASITLDDIQKDKFATVEDLANALWDVIEEGGRIRISRENYKAMSLEQLRALAKSRGLPSPANRFALLRSLAEQDKAEGGARLETAGNLKNNERHDINTETGDDHDVQTSRDRLSKQRNGNGVGGKSTPIETGDRLLADASAIGRGVEGRVQESTRVRHKEAESQARLTDYAKKNGIWHDDVEHELDALYGTEEGRKNTDGGEAVVWFDRKRGVAIKAIGLDYYGSPTLALERVELHNKYFPDTKLSIIGFGEVKDLIGKNGEVELYGRPFNIIAEQPLVDSTRKLTKAEIRARFEAQGFKFLKDRGEAGLDMETPDGKAIVSDLHERNVFKGSMGAVKVIDCDIRAKHANDSGVRLERIASDDAMRRIRQAVREEYGRVVPGENGGWEARKLSGVKMSRREFPTREDAERFAARKMADAEFHEPKKSKDPELARVRQLEAAAADLKMLLRDLNGPRIGGLSKEAHLDEAEALKLIAARGETIRGMIEAKADVAKVVDAGLDALKGLGITDAESTAKFQRRMLKLYAKRDIIKSAEIAEEVQSAMIERIKNAAAKKNLAAIERLVNGQGGDGVKKSIAKAMMPEAKSIARMDATQVQEGLAAIDEAYKQADSVERQMQLKIRESLLLNAGGILHEGTEMDYDRIRTARQFLEELAQERHDGWLTKLKKILENRQRSLNTMLKQIQGKDPPMQEGSLATTKPIHGKVREKFNFWRSFVNAGSTLWDLIDRRTAKDGKKRLSGEGQYIHEKEGDAEEQWARNNKLDGAAINKIIADFLGGKVDENGELDEATRRKFTQEWGRSPEPGRIKRYKVVESEEHVLDENGLNAVDAEGNAIMRKVYKAVEVGSADRPFVELLSVYLHMREAEAMAQQEYSNNPEKVDGADISLMRGMVANGYTRELYEDLKRELPENLKKAGEALVDYIEKVGSPIASKVYWDEYGAELRLHDRYFPLRRMNYGTAQSEFDRQSVPSIIRSFMKARTVNDYDLQPVNAFEAAVQHMRQVRQVEAYREVVNFCKDTILHPKMQKALDYFTPGLKNAFNNHVNRMAHGGISGLSDSIAWKARKVMTSANVLTTSVMFKQLMSWPMMYAHLPEGVSKHQVFAEALRMTMQDPFAVKTRELWAKGVDEGGFPYYQFRRNGNVSFDLRVLNDVNYANKLVNSKFSPARIMAKAVELGDALAFTNIGEASRRLQMRYEVEKYRKMHGGENPSEHAMHLIREKCNRELKRRIEMSQQSGALKDVSDAQAGPVSGLFFNFATAPMAIGRMFENDVRNIMAGVDVKESAFSLATIWIAQSLYQAAKDGFFTGNDDERNKERLANQAKTFLTTPLTAAMPVTASLDYLATRFTGGRTYGGWGASIAPWLDVGESIGTAVADIGKILGFNENVHADAERMGLDITKAVSQPLGLPLAGLYKNASGLYHAVADDDLTAGQRIFMPVLSPYAVGAGKKKRTGR